MDPFTEKLLERTRARRENLQKKLAERPNAANRQMVKRAREPLTDTNCALRDSVKEKTPQLSSKPSSSKRRCSEENLQPAADEENQEPVKTQTVVPVLPDASTVAPASIQQSSPVKKTLPQPDVQLNTVRTEPEKMAVTPRPDGPSCRDAPAGSTLQTNKEDPGDHVAPPAAAGMKSRFQKLAEERKCWDSDGASAPVADCVPLSMLKRLADAQPPPATSSKTPVGRRGRLANLAATIESWEDDLSHANVPSEKPGMGFVSKPAARTNNSVTPDCKAVSSSKQESLHSPVKSSRVEIPGPQKVEAPALESVHGAQKSSSQKAAFPSALQKSAVPPSPLKSSALSKGLHHIPSPQKPELQDKPTVSSSVAHQNKVPAAAPGAKSFLERFGERCQERKEHITPNKGLSSAKKTCVTPSVTPNTRLMQERLRAAHTANTTTAELTQRSRLERECELAQIRSGFQKGKSVWNVKDESAGTSMNNKVQKPVQSEVSQSEPAASTENINTPPRGNSPTGAALLTPPASTSSPVKVVNPTEEVKTEEKEEAKEQEQSISSAVISKLFNDALEQSEEEEDPLNISSMSLLTPLAETVSAVLKSPERAVMTSTPASSFIVKNTPEDCSKPSRFQRTNMVRTASSDSVDASDEDSKLPYSIDAYRSIRVKDPDRPTVKQVIVRKEDVSQRVEEPRGSSLFSVKQRMKILTNEMNLQHTIIHQASQALNCCTDEEHGKGSQVEAEAERLLLVATEKRESLRAELERLKGNPAAQKKPSGAPELGSVSPSKGSITLQDLRLPLKADFVCSTANRPDLTKHSFFILIRAGAENSVATVLASTHRGLSGDTLTFPTRFILSDVVSDFKIELQVYCLVQKSEVCSDKKKKPNKSKAITPKRFLAITKSAQTPVVANPTGPNAVRTSNFVLVGSHTLTLSSIGNNRFPLDKVPFLCPLEGHVHLKMLCEVGSKVEERGFLTMFEDVSGFGAWHRRWCVLSGYSLSYWTYPDDERRKNPIGRIILTNCSSKKVEAVNREFCARPNTFELITVRAQREDDRETLVSQCTNTMCVTRNWLSADTKEERNLWMQKVNQIVVDLRMWQPDACCKPL